VAQRWLAEDTERGPELAASPNNVYSYDGLNRVLFPQVLADGGRGLRPNYTWGALQGVHLAKTLGFKRVSLLEFGVAGGNGLVSLERTAQQLESVYRSQGIEIQVYGFDTGVGLPASHDYRDLPNVHQEGRFAMDVEKLRKRLTKAQLVLGKVEDTLADFIDSGPAPVAFMSIDLDLYTGTAHALRLLDCEQDLLLPRIYCYFDDIMGRSCCEFNGERLAIAEFNDSHEMRKIASIYGLKYSLPKQYAGKMWAEKFYLAHLFDHDLYGRYDELGKGRDLHLVDY
jgi:hypothetical protein